MRFKDITYCVSDLCPKRYACLRYIEHPENGLDFETDKGFSMSDFFHRSLFDCGYWLPDSLNYDEEKDY